VGSISVLKNKLLLITTPSRKNLSITKVEGGVRKKGKEEVRSDQPNSSPNLYLDSNHVQEQ